MKRIARNVCFLFLLAGSTTAQQSNNSINGWQISQEKYDTALIKTLKKEINNNRYRQINSIVVVKDGKLLLEEYFNGSGRNQTHNPRSVGKTFASAVLGIAISEGYIESVNQRLKEFYDLQDYQNFSAKKENVTLENFLTMSSGFEGDDNNPDSPGNEEHMYPQDDWVRWTLDLPMADDRNPGDSSVYFTAGVVVLGDIIHKSVPGGLEVYAHKKLFAPLGISNYQWQYTPQNVANTAGGIQLTPLDFAKFGQLYLSDGNWNNEQIIPKEWINNSLTRHYKTAFDNNGYGYLLWNKTYQVRNKNYNTFYCGGNGGNKIFIFKELNAVIIVTASAYNQSYAHPQVDDMMTKYILPSILVDSR